MNDQTSAICIETDLFLFDAPAGYLIVSLDDDAELVGPNDEFLMISSYSLENDSSEEAVSKFISSITAAMVEAAAEPDLTITGQLKKVTADNGLPIWSVLSEANDQSHFFDQYAVVKNTVAVVVMIEGGYQDRPSSAEIEESVHGLDFK